MSSTEVATVLTLHVEQIIDGKPSCDYCERDALWMIGTGADPTPVPHCPHHARMLVGATALTIEGIGDGSPSASNE